MHAAARAFVERWARPEDEVIVEIGSRNINGEIRDLFPEAWHTYVGLDILPGPGVDIVCDAAEWEPPEPVDCVLCCEVLEHAANWRGILMQACSWLRPGGRLILTCAGPGRSPHSAIDGEDLREGEYYRNLVTWEIIEVLSSCGIRIEVSEYLGQSCDCRLIGTKRHDAKAAG